MHALEPSAPPSHPLAGRYRILNEIARGGMGVVYAGVDLQEERQVAIKMLSARPDDHEAVLRFRDEARTASSLSHPSICRIHGIGDDHRRPFIVMELLEGETLKHWIPRTRCEPARILDVTVQVAEGLEAAHAKAIIHRDVKPANVFITRDGAVKILDFGLAKTFDWDGDRASTLTLTGARQIPGTVAYMAPERLLGKSLDQRADLYSLGVMLYEMLCGCRPFRGTSTVETIASIVHGVPSTLLPAMPMRGEWKHVILRMIAKEPRQRYDNASRLLEDLRTLRRMLNGEQASLASREFASARAERAVAIVDFRIDDSERPTGRLTGRHPRHFAQHVVRRLMETLASTAGVKLVPGTPVKAPPGYRESLAHVARRVQANRVLTGAVKTTTAGELSADISMYDAGERLLRWTRRYRRGGDDPVRLRERIVKDVVMELDLESDDLSTRTSDITQIVRDQKLIALRRLIVRRSTPTGAVARRVAGGGPKADGLFALAFSPGLLPVRLGRWLGAGRGYGLEKGGSDARHVDATVKMRAFGNRDARGSNVSVERPNVSNFDFIARRHVPSDRSKNHY